MRLADRLNSYPVIAIAALLLAGLVGLVVGFASIDKPSPTIQRGNVEMMRDDRTGGGGPLGDLTGGPRDGTGKNNNSRNGAGRNGGTGTNGSTTRRDPTENGTNGGNNGGDTNVGPIKVGEPRKLPDGRKDEVSTVPVTQQPTCAIQVSVTDSRGIRLPFALLALDVNSGPLGWHGVPPPPKNVPEERGVFRAHLAPVRMSVVCAVVRHRHDGHSYAYKRHKTPTTMRQPN